MTSSRRRISVVLVLVFAAACCFGALHGPSAGAFTASSSCGGATADSSQGVWHAGSITTLTATRWYRFTLASSRHALITLGALNADLALGLYDSSCHLVSTSNRSGDHYEEIYRSLGAGSYYARVAGVSGATSTFQVRFRALPNAVTVLSSRGVVSGGEVSVVGEVLNNTGVPFATELIEAIFYDASGRVVTTSAGFTDDAYVAPWQRAPFQIDTAVPPTYSHYRLIADDPASDAVRAAGPLSFTVSPSQPFNTVGRQYPWTLKNTNGYAVYALVAAVIRDRLGNVIAESANPPAVRIAAGATLKGTVYFADVTGENSISIYASATRS